LKLHPHYICDQSMTCNVGLEKITLCMNGSWSEDLSGGEEREKSPITAKAQPEIYGEVDRTVFQFLE
jgi:hypothetical protein